MITKTILALGLCLAAAFGPTTTPIHRCAAPAAPKTLLEAPIPGALLQDDAGPLLPGGDPGAGRFATITVTIDPGGVPLAAYQFEITAGWSFTVVGLDHAGHPAFADPPRYDRRIAGAGAEAGGGGGGGTDRLVVADYSTDAAEVLIDRPQQVAVIHAAFTPPEHAGGGVDLDTLAQAIDLTLTAAADAAGEHIDAKITYDLHLAERPGQE